ncbi:MAG: hypothetical protein CMF80_07305 [Candidatus Marinimicrobia bacterium]|nr:hypothetical protein [Candidatus Neomarinimicrobiota bacterium]|tara:strand:+ start:37 stop:522 length:486 start_codon:yes stop_codon:yes gene_type:complete
MNIEESWLKNFKYHDKKKNPPIFEVKLFFLYVNSKNELEYLKEGSTYILQSKIFDKKDIIKNIKENQYIHKKKYKLISLLKFNIDINIENLEDFLLDTHDKNYMTALNNLEDITFTNNSTLFNELNNIFFVFLEDNYKNNTTKKIKFNTKTRNNKTKRFKA